MGSGSSTAARAAGATTHTAPEARDDASPAHASGAAAAAPARENSPVALLLAKASPLTGAPNPGDCPFAHCVRMSYHVAGVPLDVQFVDAAQKPAWLLAAPYNGGLPCLVPSGLVHDGAGAVVESADIARRALPPTPTDEAALAAAAGLFPRVCKYIKNAHNDAALREALDEVLQALEGHLERSGAEFLSGAAPGYADCWTATKLHILHSVGGHFNGWTFGGGDGDEISTAAGRAPASSSSTTPVRLPLLRAYCKRVFALPAFKDTAYPDAEAIKGWGDEREPPLHRHHTTTAPAPLQHPRQAAAGAWAE